MVLTACAVHGKHGIPSVATPVGIALGATWNPDLVEKVGNVLADELEIKGAHILLAPTVNIIAHPSQGETSNVIPKIHSSAA